MDFLTYNLEKMVDLPKMKNFDRTEATATALYLDKMKQSVSDVISLESKAIYTHISRIKSTFYKIMDERNRIVRSMKVEKYLTYNKLLNSCDIGLSTVMISSKIKKLLKFKKIMTKEDYLLWLILSKKYKIIGINKYLTNWRSVKDSLSSSLIQKFKDGFKVYNKYLGKSRVISFFRVINLSINFVFKLFKQKFIFRSI